MFISLLTLAIYIFMARDAANSKTLKEAYVKSCFGGILRSMCIMKLSDNFHPNTILSIVFWHYLSKMFFQKTKQQHTIITEILNAASIVLFGTYGIIVTPELGAISYVLTSCGGGVFYEFITNTNACVFLKKVARGKIWIIIESIIICAFINTPHFIIPLIALLIIFRIIYIVAKGKDIYDFITALLCLRMRTCYGKVYLRINHLHIIIPYFNPLANITSVKLKINLCRRQFRLSHCS